MTYRELIACCYKALVDYVKKKPTNAVINEARNNENLTSRQLLDLQREKFNHLIEQIASSNSYFWNKIEARGVTLDELRDIRSLWKIPVLTKEEVRNNRYAMCGMPRGKFFEGKTSGSTGIALAFYNDSLSLAWADACKWRGRMWLGASRYHSSLVLWGQPLYLGKFGARVSRVKNYLRNVRLFNTFGNIDDKFLREVCACIVKDRPRYIYGYGSSIAALSRFIKERKVQINYSPLFVQFTADHMSRSERRATEEVFGCRVVSDYGSSELPGIAEECEQGNLHISIDNYVVEILGDDGKEVPIGAVGEVTVTALHAFGFPFVRYRTGDLGRKVAGACECGRPFPIFSLEAGKAVDLISTSEAKNVSAHVLDYINLRLMKENLSGIAQFYLEQVSTDSFILSIVKEDKFNEQSVEDFLQGIRSYLGANINIDVVFVSDIPVTKSGKRRYFGKASNFVSGCVQSDM